MPITEQELQIVESRLELKTDSDACTVLSYARQMVDTIRELQSQLNAKPRSRSKKQKIEEALRESDVTATLAQRDDITYGHHDMVPRGEHLALTAERLVLSTAI